MKHHFISKLINLSLWEGVDRFFLSNQTDGLSLDFYQDYSEDMLLANKAKDKLDEEIYLLNSNRNLNSGESLNFIEKTSFGYKEISLTKLASENKKYSIVISNTNDKNSRLSQLGFHHFQLEKLKNHLLSDKAQGLILVVGDNASDRNKTIISLVNLFKNKTHSILSLNNKLPLEDIISLNLDLFQKPSLSSQEIFSLIKKHQADVIVNNVYNHNINQALLDLSLENKIVISSAEDSNSLEALYKLRQNHSLSDLKNNLSLVICQKFVSRLCPYCQEKSPVNKYQKNYLKNLGFRYNWKNLEEKSRHSCGCPRCLYSGKKGEIGIFETLSFKNDALNTPNLINDAKAKYDLGLIDVEDLLSFC